MKIYSAEKRLKGMIAYIRVVSVADETRTNRRACSEHGSNIPQLISLLQSFGLKVVVFFGVDCVPHAAAGVSGVRPR